MTRVSIETARVRSFVVATGVVLLFATLTSEVIAHLNNPHVYVEERVGPYDVMMVVEMPPAVPGDAEVQVLFRQGQETDDVTVRVREIPPQGEDTAPPWNEARRDADDPSFYSSPMPLTLPGFWQVRIEIEGPRGTGSTTIPVPARVPQPRVMPAGTIAQLGVLGLFLLVSLGFILGAIGRLSHRRPRETVTVRDRRRGRIAGGTAIVIMVAYLAWVGSFWNRYHRYHKVLATPQMTGELSVINPPAIAGRNLLLEYTLRDRRGRAVLDLVPTRGKGMHLAIVEHPGAAYLAQLHPLQTGPGVFRFVFTPPRAGTYRTFANVVLRSGEADTISNELRIGTGTRGVTQEFRDPDNVEVSAPPIGSADTIGRMSPVEDGASLEWIGGADRTFRAREPARLRFRLLRSDGRPMESLDSYLDARGRLLVMREDGEVFSQVYPSGTVGRSDVEPAGDGERRSTVDVDDGASVSFPFGFPTPGRYRMWVQVRHDDGLSVGVFDVDVTS